MKKFLTIIMSLLLTLSLALATGCDSTFNGDFEEVSADNQELTGFAAKVEETEDAEEIDFASGYKITLEMESSTTYGEETQTVSMDFEMKSILKDGKLNLSSEMVMELNGKETETALYYADGYAYSMLKSGEQELKTKLRTDDVDDVIGDAVQEIEGMMSELSIVELLEMAGNVEIGSEDQSIKFYMDKGEDQTKIKVEASMNGGNSEVVLVYDANNRLIAARMISELNSEEGTGEMKIEIKPWSGSVKLPGDLDTYLGL